MKAQAILLSLAILPALLATPATVTPIRVHATPQLAISPAKDGGFLRLAFHGIAKSHLVAEQIEGIAVTIRPDTPDCYWVFITTSLQTDFIREVRFAVRNAHGAVCYEFEVGVALRRGSLVVSREKAATLASILQSIEAGLSATK